MAPRKPRNPAAPSEKTTTAQPSPEAPTEEALRLEAEAFQDGAEAAIDDIVEASMTGSGDHPYRETVRRLIGPGFDGFLKSSFNPEFMPDPAPQLHIASCTETTEDE